LARSFAAAGHKSVHVNDLGWKGSRNGEVLERISGRYDALVTGDTNMGFQQDLGRFDVAVLVLQPRRKVLAEPLELVPAAMQALSTAPRGEATVIRPG
jgi:hypothetical protein